VHCGLAWMRLCFMYDINRPVEKSSSKPLSMDLARRAGEMKTARYRQTGPSE
jgi:hypothetical protein